MKEYLNRLFSVTMALLLLASTTSWTVGKHYCMGRLISVSLFEHADDCGMDMPMPSSNDNQLTDGNSCCDEELIVVEGQDDLQKSSKDFSFDHQLVFHDITDSFIDLFGELKNKQVLNEYYPPPLLTKDIQLLDEVFII